MDYPSNEDAGIWIFEMEGDVEEGDSYLPFGNLNEGWSYEGWIVRDHGSEDEFPAPPGRTRVLSSGSRSSSVPTAPRSARASPAIDG